MTAPGRRTLLVNTLPPWASPDRHVAAAARQWDNDQTRWWLEDASGVTLPADVEVTGWGSRGSHGRRRREVYIASAHWPPVPIGVPAPVLNRPPRQLVP